MFFKRVDKNDQKVKYSIARFLMEKELEEKCLDFIKIHNVKIHNVVVKTKRDIVHITIFCERPGVLVGVQGKTIASLKQFVSEDISKNIEIFLKEFYPLPDIYDYNDVNLFDD